MILSPPNQVITDSLRKDPRLLYFATYQPQFWVDEFGADRIRTFPIAEGAMVGSAIGAAIAGFHSIVHLNRATFSFVAMDQIANQAAKLRYMSGGQFSIGLTLRAQTRGDDYLGAQHEQSPYSLFTHIPGIKVVVPATLEDAAGLYLTALNDPNTVFVFESPLLYQQSWDRNIPTDAQPIPFGQARIRREGRDVTIVAVGVMVADALAASERLVERHNISCTVIDPRTLAPLDIGSIIASVKETGRLIVVDEAPATASIAAEIIAAVCEHPSVYGGLAAPPARVSGAPVPAPFSPMLQPQVLPSVGRIVEAVEHVVNGEARNHV